MEQFAEVLKENDILELLDLSDCHVHSKGGLVLADSLRYNKGLKRLYLSHNNVGKNRAKRFAKALKENKELKLEELNLSHNDIEDEGAIALAESAKNTTLKVLDVSYNRNIGDKGMKALEYLTNVSVSIGGIY